MQSIFFEIGNQKKRVSGCQTMAYIDVLSDSSGRASRASEKYVFKPRIVFD